MNRNSLGVLSGAGGLARNEVEASVASRSAVERQSPAEALAAASHPDPEVVARPQRRSYTAEYKVRILREAEAAAAIRGGIGALLRREGLDSSLLVDWRRERTEGIREGLTPQKRGPKSKRHPLADEMQKLQRQNARLNEELRKAHIIIDAQKKVAALLGHPLPDEDLEKDS
jgi:transposase